MTRVIVADQIPSHASGIRGAISTGYGSDISEDIEIEAADLGPSIAYAQSVGAIAVVHSYAGIEGHISEAGLIYPVVQCFMPLGSNSYAELFNLPSVPVIVSCGAGLSQNNTAYGLGLEFWDTPDHVSSNSTGIVCGKLLQIRDTLGCTWWEARYRARKTASNNGVWDKFNGYGRIDVAAAIAFDGSIPYDPFVAPSIARLGAVELLSPGLESLSVE